MANELVSVVIPSYNRPDRTQRAIDSVAAQSYSPIELLVIDDGSSPPLAENLSLPHEQIASVQLITHNENQGANVARNTGIDNASGSYLAFLDSDDEWDKDKIGRQLSNLHSKEAIKASYTGVQNVDADGQLNSIKKATAAGDLSRLLLSENVIGTFSSLLVSSDIINEVGKPDPDLPCYQDWEWYLRLSQETKFLPIADPLTVRHNEGGQISDNFKAKYEIAYPILKDRLTEYANSEQERKRAISGLQQRIGYSALTNRRYSDARRFFIKSIFNSPQNWRSYLYLLITGSHYKRIKNLKRTLVRIMYD